MVNRLRTMLRLATLLPQSFYFSRLAYGDFSITVLKRNLNIGFNVKYNYTAYVEADCREMTHCTVPTFCVKAASGSRYLHNDGS